MQTTKLIIVGGFLGAGKTTLLWEAAQRFMQQGLHVGLITNDQAPELVDRLLMNLLRINILPIFLHGSIFSPAGRSLHIDLLKLFRLM